MDTGALVAKRFYKELTDIQVGSYTCIFKSILRHLLITYYSIVWQGRTLMVSRRCLKIQVPSSCTVFIANDNLKMKTDDKL